MNMVNGCPRCDPVTVRPASCECNERFSKDGMRCELCPPGYVGVDKWSRCRQVRCGPGERLAPSPLGSLCPMCVKIPVVCTGCRVAYSPDRTRCVQCPAGTVATRDNTRCVRLTCPVAQVVTVNSCPTCGVQQVQQVVQTGVVQTAGVVSCNA